MSSSTVIIGVDESGTGAWSGPYTVCAVALTSVESVILATAGVTDSKKLSDSRRRKLAKVIADTASAARCVFVRVDDIDKRGKDAWRSAMVAVVLDLHRRFTSSEVIIDGSFDKKTSDQLSRLGISSGFMTQADSRVIAVGAASIIAKTMRNDAMIKLDQIHPGYGWAKNAGYGTPDHIEAIKVLGRTAEHRKIRRRT